MEVVFVQAATFVMMPVCLSAKQAAHTHTHMQMNDWDS